VDADRSVVTSIIGPPARQAGGAPGSEALAYPAPFEQRDSARPTSLAECDATSAAGRGKDKDSRPPDREALILGEIGSCNDQAGPVARRHQDQVGLVRTYVPGAIARLQAATHGEPTR
jgi:hypothetical protein